MDFVLWSGGKPNEPTIHLYGPKGKAKAVQAGILSALYRAQRIQCTLISMAAIYSFRRSAEMNRPTKRSHDGKPCQIYYWMHIGFVRVDDEKRCPNQVATFFYYSRSVKYPTKTQKRKDVAETSRFFISTHFISLFNLIIQINI
jgi:hypothetical protein